MVTRRRGPSRLTVVHVSPALLFTLAFLLLSITHPFASAAAVLLRQQQSAQLPEFQLSGESDLNTDQTSSDSGSSKENGGIAIHGQQTWAVTQSDGRASLDALFRISNPSHQTELYASHQIQDATAELLTSVENVTPVFEGPGIAIRATLRFDGIPGSGPVSVRVITNAGNAYSANITFTVRGLAIAGSGIISGAWRPGLSLGSWDQWAGPRRFAVLPIIANPGLSNGLGVSVREVPTGNAGTPVGILAGPGDPLGVDALRLEGSHQACSATVDVEADGSVDVSGDEEDQNASVFRGGTAHSARVSFINGACGIAFSEDGRWLILRLEKYTVGTFGFQVRLTAPASGPSRSKPIVVPLGGPEASVPDSAVTSHINFFYDTSSIPPPVFPTVGGSASLLDAYGGEVLSFKGVKNTDAPPRPAALGNSSFVLRETAAGSPKETQSISLQGGKNATVTFQTPEWDEDDVGSFNASDRSFEIFFQSNSPSVVRTGRWQISRQSTGAKLHKVLVSSGDDTRGGELEAFSYASPEKAVLGPCDDAFKGTGIQARRRFGVVRLGMERYRAERFSQHKADQFTSALGNALSVENVRFFNFDNTRREAIFEVPLGAEETSSSLSRKIRAKLENGEIESQVRLTSKSTKLSGVSVTEFSEVCKAATADPRGIAAFDGLAGSPMPWILGLVSALMFALLASVIVGYYSLRGRFKSGYSDSSMSSTSESDFIAGGSGRTDRRRLTDRQRDESFGLHQGPSRRRERNDVVVHIQPDTETVSQSSERRLSSPRVPMSPQSTGFARIWTDRRQRASRRGVEPFVEGVEEVYDEETTETGTSDSTSDREVYSGSSMRRESREERVEGYVSQSDPLVARLTHALRSQNASPQSNFYVNRDTARDQVQASPRPYAPFVDRSATPSDEVEAQSGTVSNSGSGSPVVAYTASSSRRFQGDRSSTPPVRGSGGQRMNTVEGDLEGEGLSVSEASTDSEPASPDVPERWGTWEGHSQRAEVQQQQNASAMNRPPTPDLHVELD